MNILSQNPKPYYILLLLFIILVSCEQVSKSSNAFFLSENCQKIDFTNGVELVDPLGRFTFNVPDSSWALSELKSIEQPDLFLFDHSDTNSYILIIEIDMENQEEEAFIEDLEVIHEKGSVLKSGFIIREQKKIPWFLVDFNQTEQPVYHLFFYLTDRRRNKAYQISLASYTTESDFEPLCKLSGFIETFKIR